MPYEHHVVIVIEFSDGGDRCATCLLPFQSTFCGFLSASIIVERGGLFIYLACCLEALSSVLPGLRQGAHPRWSLLDLCVWEAAECVAYAEMLHARAAFRFGERTLLIELQRDR